MKTPAEGARRGVHIGGLGMAANVVREALHTIANRDVAVRIITRALHHAQEQQIPSGGRRLRIFVDRHLRTATAFVLDEDLAEQLLSQLQPLLARIPSIEPVEQSRAAKELDDHVGIGGIAGIASLDDETSGIILSRPTEAAPVDRTVLIASQTDALVAQLGAAVAGAPLVLIDDIVTLLDRVKESFDPPIVIVDCSAPTVQPTTLATMGEDLPAGAEVILWGPDPIDEETARSLVESPDRWYGCESDLPSLIALLTKLLHV